MRVANSQFLDVRDWNHIAFVYDAPRRQARLYVNVALQELDCADPPDGTCESVSWASDVLTYQATASLEVGRVRSGGVLGRATGPNP